MTTSRNPVSEAYFEWMIQLVCEDRFSEEITYRKLLEYLHDTEFRYSIARDGNRYADGVDLRYRFAYEHAGIEHVEDYIYGPCSVLEMMVALAVRCETNIMDDPSVGDRTGQWFWRMITNLGLGAMSDDRFDEKLVEKVVTRFLDRKYMPNGKGGLFTIKNCPYDLRNVEIWYQLNWYLDSVSGY